MKRAAVLQAAAGAAFLASARIADAAQKLTITVASGEVDNGPYFVASQRGYFAAEGFEPNLVFAGGGIATPGLISGSVDGSASSATALTAILRGAELRIVLVFSSTPPYQLWATRDVRSMADLKGKTIGIATRGDTLEIATRLALQAGGVPAESVGYTPLGSASNIGAGLETGGLPAVVLTPGRVETMQGMGQLKNAHMLADYFGNVHMPLNGLAVSAKMLYGDPGMARKMIRAVVKGGRYVKAFKAQTIAITSSYQNGVVGKASEAEYDVFTRGLARDFIIGSDLLASDLLVRAELTGVAKDKLPALDKIYDFSVLRSVNAELDAARWKPAP